MPSPHNHIGGSNGKVVCPRNTAGTGHKTEYSRRQDTKTEYSRRQDTKQNTAGDRTKKRREYPPKQDSAKTQ